MFILTLLCLPVVLHASVNEPNHHVATRASRSAIVVQEPDPVTALQQKVGDIYKQVMGSAMPSLLGAQAKLLEARGSKDQAALLRATAAAAQAGANKVDRASWEQIQQVASESSKQIGSMFADSASAVDNASRTLFIDGAKGFLDGTAQTTGIAQQLSGLQKSVEAVSKLRNPMQMRSAKPALDVASVMLSGLPALTQTETATAKALISYAQKQKLPLPAGSTDLFKGN